MLRFTQISIDSKFGWPVTTFSDILGLLVYYCREFIFYFIVYKSLMLYTVYIYVGIENILFPCNPELVDLLDI